MAYPQTSGRLPYETASRTGHLPLMSDPLIRDLVHEFQIPEGIPLTAEHRYGERNLLGERVFVLLPEGRQFVLTVPSALEQNLPDRPQYTDLIGLDEILRILPGLVTPVYDNALYPISRVNALVSMSQEPSGRMLELFSETLLRERDGAGG